MSQYRTVATKQARRDIKKLDLSVQKKILARMREIEEAPYEVGDKLKGALHDIFRTKVRVNQSDYRIAYVILEEIITIEIVAVGSRENFYQKLKLEYSQKPTALYPVSPLPHGDFITGKEIRNGKR